MAKVFVALLIMFSSAYGFAVSVSASAHFALTMAFSSTSHSAAILQILPTRVVFDENTRSVDVFLKNRGDSDGEYRISLRNQRMTEDGRFEIIEKGQEQKDELLADGLIRYAPRRVTISKNLTDDAQTIRLALRKPKGLADGEYRTHLLITSMPKTNASSNSEISIYAKVEISIPVIVRVGALNAEVSISDGQVFQNGDEKALSFRLNRIGTRSIYGNIKVTQMQDNKSVELAFLSGMSVYVPNALRIVTVPLGNYKPGAPIRISFKENPQYGGNEEAQLELK